MRLRDLVGVVVLAVAFGSTPATASAQRLYLALGDSVTVGPGGPQAGFVERYYQFLNAPSHGGLDRLSNLAIAGETSTSMRNPGGQLDRAVAAIDGPSDTRVVTLDIGGNDAFTGQCSHAWTAEQCPFRANYTAIVQRLAGALANDPGAETFQVMEYYNPASGTGSPIESGYDTGLLGADLRIDCSGTGSSLGLNDLIACIGGDNGAGSVDTYPTFKAGGQRLLVGIHPSQTGYRYIACLFERPERAGSPQPCPPSIVLSGPRRQRVLIRHRLSVVVRVDQVAKVTASATIAIPRLARVVRLLPRTVTVAAGKRTRLALRLAKQDLRAVRRALLARGRLVVTVRARARGAVDSSRTATRKIKLVQ
jgi:GDSL-like Lipase/Acylhydrolase family